MYKKAGRFLARNAGLAKDVLGAGKQRVSRRTVSRKVALERQEAAAFRKRRREGMKRILMDWMSRYRMLVRAIDERSDPTLTALYNRARKCSDACQLWDAIRQVRIAVGWVERDILSQRANPDTTSCARAEAKQQKTVNHSKVKDRVKPISARTVTNTIQQLDAELWSGLCPEIPFSIASTTISGVARITLHSGLTSFSWVLLNQNLPLLKPKDSRIRAVISVLGDLGIVLADRDEVFHLVDTDSFVALFRAG